jgi:hypothetical protein
MPFTTVRSTIQIGTTLFVTMQSHINNFEELKIGDTVGLYSIEMPSVYMSMRCAKN